ncbi:MAG: hypothetical protein NTX82_04670 [Candidatus Parcubacteria bacterium]|nr:hypothetical protein [Candidatus Parcubacteria bacterium]
MNDLKEILKQTGLNAKEAKVYLAILNLGKCNVTEIAQKAELKRTSLYEYLEKLLQQGLIFKTVTKKRTYYYPESPAKIITALDKQKVEIEDKKEKIRLIIPELEKIYSSVYNKPRISFHEGKEGLREIYWKIFDTSKIIYSIFSPDNFFKLYSAKENHALLMLLYNKGGMLRSLVEKTKEPRPELKEKEYRKFIQSKELPENFKFETDLLVVDNITALISFKNLIGVIIEDEAIADLQKNFIKNIWVSQK